MKKILSLALVMFICSFATAQLISKKEAAAIDNILNEASSNHKPGTYLIQHVNILTMKDSVILKDRDVLIENGLIRNIGTGLSAEQAIRIDGTGKFLMPGLTDMHVHLFDGHPLKNTWILNLVLNGVTTVRDLYGSPEKLTLREKIKSNEVLAPTLYQSGPIINGVKDNFSAYAGDEKQGRELVAAHKKAGYDFIKVYDGLSKKVYAAILDEASIQQIAVVGHVPDAVPVSEAIALGQKTIEHLTGYFEWQGSQIKITAENKYVGITAESSTWNCPTIYNHFLNGSRSEAANVIAYAEKSGLIPNDVKTLWQKRVNSTSKDVIEIVDKYGSANFEALKTILLALYESNATLVAGTDAGNLPFLIPGYSLHQELKLMNSMGIPAYEVLKMTTIHAATAMGRESEFGTIEIGKRGDLLLLDANPLHNLDHLQRKSGIMIRGIWLSGDDLESLNAKIRATFNR